MRTFLELTLKVLTALAIVLCGGVTLRAEIIYWPMTALDLAKQRSESVSCVNHLKQIVLAARISSLGGGAFPQRILNFTNELDSPAVLFCPADIDRQVSTNWADFDLRSSDYEWLPQPNWNNPDAICCRCRIHNNVAQVNGSVRLLFGYRSGWPAIVAAPLQQYATPGSEVRFEVGVAPDSLQPISYQWRRQQLYLVTNVTFHADPEDPSGGFWTTNRRGQFTTTILSGETNLSYVIANTQTNHTDYYSVVASNALGSTASNPSHLFVDPWVSARITNNYWSAVNCVNNLKQIALFGRMMANDRDEQMPPSLSAMTNAYGAPIFGWPVVLYCRFDAARTVPADWAGVDLANTSYEVLPGDSADFDAPFCRCKVHGFYAKMDGAVVSKPHFSGIRRLTNHTAELTFTVFAGQTNVLETSTNLANWATLSSYSSTNGNFVFHDTNSFPQRFYRIRTE